MLNAQRQALLAKVAVAFAAFAAGAGLVAWVTMQPTRLSALEAGYASGAAASSISANDADPWRGRTRSRPD